MRPANDSDRALVRIGFGLFDPSRARDELERAICAADDKDVCLRLGGS